MIPTLVRIADYEAENSERILWTPSYIGSTFLWLLEYDVKSVDNSALRGSSYFGAVLGV